MDTPSEYGPSLQVVHLHPFKPFPTQLTSPQTYSTSAAHATRAGSVFLEGHGHLLDD